MKIKYEISYRQQQGEMQNYIASKPGQPRDEAIDEWMQLRYRTWIKDNIVASLSDFTFDSETNDPVSFNLDFKKNADGQKFHKMMGGRIIE